MLDKKKLSIGDLVKVVSLKNKTAGIWLGDISDTMPSITVHTAFPSVEYDPDHSDEYLIVGDIVKIIKLPRKVYGINVCRVAVDSGREGEVFWTELRGNCEMVITSNTQSNTENQQDQK